MPVADRGCSGSTGKNPDTVFMDNRTLETELCDGRKLVIAPDVIGDFRAIPVRGTIHSNWWYSILPRTC